MLRATYGVFTQFLLKPLEFVLNYCHEVEVDFSRLVLGHALLDDGLNAVKPVPAVGNGTVVKGTFLQSVQLEARKELAKVTLRPT
jgi:hypothetical protein